jgi:threonine synthase
LAGSAALGGEPGRAIASLIGLHVVRYRSTRSPAIEVSLSEAVERGLAADGGLFVPTTWPRLAAPNDLVASPASLAQVAVKVLAPFFADDSLRPELAGIATEAFTFSAPLVGLGDEGPGVLELFHGPTAAFKDFGAQFLAALLARLRGDRRERVILVATSGDTGGAVAAAFFRRPGFRVVLLYPRGRVSPTQERQLTCWGDNIVSCAVRGSFDDCQRMVKQALADPALRAARRLSSANSINLGRLLPQVAYYAAASLTSHARGRSPLSFIIPSGNLGNAFACAVARAMGMPIGRIVLAHNANRAVPDFLASGAWEPRASIATLASAMDVGNPSNIERFHALFPSLPALRSAISASAVEDEAIRARIRLDYQRWNRIWCPHSAVAAEVFGRLPAPVREGESWCIVATAHPAKFPEVVEPLIGQAVEVPESLRRLSGRTAVVRELDPTDSALASLL